LPGGTIKLLVNKLGIQKEDVNEQKLINKDVNEKMIDHLMAGVESVVGRRMSRYRILDLFTKFDTSFTKKILIRSNAEDPLTLKFQKISLDEHYARLYGPAMLVAQNKVESILEQETETQSSVLPRKKSSTTHPIQRKASRIARYTNQQTLEDQRSLIYDP
jgi:hypothetical protein